MIKFKLSKLAEDIIDGKTILTDRNPTKLQKEVGNYRKAQITVGGMKILIENPAGSKRSGHDWEVIMKHHYGYFPGYVGKDGDDVDVFVRKGLDSEWRGTVFIINQKNQEGKFDEHKVVFGATTKEHARQIYNSNYSPGWNGVLSIGEASFDDFKKWLRSGNTKKPFEPEPERKKLSESLLG